MIKLSTIKPNPDNPRVIKDGNFRKLQKSIQDFPQMMSLRPMVIDDNCVILGCNMRYRALQDSGVKEVPDEWIKRARDLTEDQKREFIIKDNVGFGEWDWDALGNGWDDLALADWGLEVPTFDDLSVDDEEDQTINASSETVKNTHRVRLCDYDIILTDDEYDMIKRSLDEYVNNNGITAGYFYHILNR